MNRLHWRIANIRADWQHKLTTALARQYSIVMTESLNVKGMMKNKRLSRSLADVGFGELVRQLSYKSDVTKVDRFFASSKTCSCCKSKVDELPLSIRVWRCEVCGTEHDRDVNAAINILAEGLRVLAEANKLEQFPVSCTGCGGGSAGLVTQSLSGTLSNEARIER